MRNILCIGSVQTAVYDIARKWGWGIFFSRRNDFPSSKVIYQIRLVDILEGIWKCPKSIFTFMMFTEYLE
jgi:hypothetical protein